MVASDGGLWDDFRDQEEEENQGRAKDQMVEVDKRKDELRQALGRCLGSGEGRSLMSTGRRKEDMEI